MTRFNKAIADIQHGAAEVSILHDAYMELADVVRMVAKGEIPAGQLQGISDMVLRQQIKRELLHSTFYTPSEAPTPATPTPSVPVAVTIMQDLLASNQHPMGITEVNWDSLTDDRRALSALCAEYPEKVEPAILKRTLRPWFTTKLFQKGSIHAAADLLVTMTFAEAARQCAA